ncbi:hypothetical protein AB1L30_24835 [Bremerella sp. JC817]|uniref:hypothetical protein n=1 Tax=Bremerella sp. JC817 TaxID=3231756 RepID=UPI003459F30F
MTVWDWVEACFSPPPSTAVICDDEGVSMAFTRRRVVRIAWRDLVRVAIETNDRGPFEEDVFFVLETDDNRVAIPQSFSGTDGLISYLGDHLPGFDFGPMIAAMASADNQEFVCWEKQTD